MKKLFFILYFLLICSEVFAGIAFDTSGSDASGYTASLTVSITVSDVENRLMIGACKSGTASSVTFNGDSFTFLETGKTFYLLNPDVGTHDVVFTRSGTEGFNCGVSVFNGVKQQAPEASAYDDTTSSSPSVSITTLTDNALIVDLINIANGPTTYTPQTGSTQGFLEPDYGRLGSAYKILSTAGLTTMGWTLNQSVTSPLWAYAFEEAGTASTWKPKIIGMY